MMQTSLLNKKASLLSRHQSTATAKLPQNAPIPFRRGNRGRGRGCYFGKGGRRKYNSGFGRSHTKHSCEFDAYCMDVAQLNIFENQVSLWD